MVYPDIKAGHIFQRITVENVSKVRAIRDDWKWWNKLFIAHTLLDDELRDKCLSHLYPIDNDEKRDACLSQAKVWIRANMSTIKEIREYNKTHGKLISE